MRVYVCACTCVRVRTCGHRVCVCVHEQRGRERGRERERERERKATEQSAEPRSIVSTRLERLNRSTSLLLYALCAPRTRAPNERTPTAPSRTVRPPPFVLSRSLSRLAFTPSTFPALFLSFCFSLSLSFSLSGGAKPSTNLVTRTPGFKNARLSTPYARASLVFLFP